jgi:sigma-B regulation protein RsbU (phosphoserine phosphatase)
MNFFSIRWKITISLVVFSLAFVGIYIVLASRIFEHDKISYVFETQQKQVESVATNFANEVNRAVLGARAVVMGMDPVTRQIQPSAKRFFDEEKSILGIDLSRGGNPEPLFKLQKSEKLFDELGDLGRPSSVNGEVKTGIEVHHWKDDIFVLSITDFDRDQEPVATRVILQISGLLDDALEGQTLVLSDHIQPAIVSDEAEANMSQLQELLKGTVEGFPDGTTTRKFAGESYLVSKATAALEGFSVIGLLPERVAMSVLKTLYRRSMLFLLFSAFAIICISLVLSFGLTRNINNLTLAAGRFGQGDFTQIPDSRARDEVGVLTKAFQSMVVEIQRLLKETVDKTRMEQELKTARLVQESLFPEKQDTRIKNISVSGFYATSSECGGDWWYYYSSGDEVIIAVADATGHGTPAALVTSAARALFSYVETVQLPLKEIASLWNEAVAVCSKQKVFMTAILARVNTVTGAGSLINAGHEPPLLLSQRDSKYSSEFLMSPQNATLGERGKRNWTETHFQIPPGARLLIYTDGLLAFKSPEGGTVGERRFMKAVEKMSAENKVTREFVESIFKHFDKFGGNTTLPDDVTFVVVENSSKSTV